MFTGIIKNTGLIKEISKDDNFLTVNIDNLKSNIGDSLAIDGACLTISKITNSDFTFQISEETIAKTIVSNYSDGDYVNVEKAATAKSLLGGHMVLGHIDSTTLCSEIELVKDNLWNFYFLIDNPSLVVDKGSITINGISLTSNKLNDNKIYTSIVEHTFKETTFKHMSINDEVNIEYDIIGKYINEQK